MNRSLHCLAHGQCVLFAVGKRSPGLWLTIKSLCALVKKSFRPKFVKRIKPSRFSQKAVLQETGKLSLAKGLGRRLECGAFAWNFDASIEKLADCETR